MKSKVIIERRQGLGTVDGYKIYRNIAEKHVFGNIKQLVMAEILRNYPDCSMIYVGSTATLRIESCTEEDTAGDNTLYIMTDEGLQEVGLLNADNGVVQVDNDMIFFDYTELEEPDQNITIVVEDGMVYTVYAEQPSVVTYDVLDLDTDDDDQAAVNCSAMESLRDRCYEVAGWHDVPGEGE